MYKCYCINTKNTIRLDQLTIECRYKYNTRLFKIPLEILLYYVFFILCFGFEFLANSSDRS